MKNPIIFTFVLILSIYRPYGSSKNLNGIVTSAIPKGISIATESIKSLLIVKILLENLER